jgi:YVTN family beta-propeller protein
MKKYFTKSKFSLKKIFTISSPILVALLLVVAGSTPAHATVCDVNTGSQPISIVKVGQYGYVANYSHGTVTVFDPVTYAIITTIAAVGSNPIKLIALGTKIYVMHDGIAQNTITVIDSTTNTILTTINIGLNLAPNDAYVVGTNMYVISGNTVPFGSIAIIDTITNTFTGSIPMTVSQNQPFHAVVFGTKIYVIARLGQSLFVVDTTTNTITTTLVLPGGGAQNLVLIGTKIYVINGANTVTVVNTGTNSIVANITMTGITNGGNDEIFAIGTKIYVPDSSSNVVSVADTITNTWIKNIPVAAFPISAQVVGTHLYVGSYNGNVITDIDSATDTVVPGGVIAGFNNPRGIGVLIGTYLYETDQGSNRILVIDTVTDTLVSLCPFLRAQSTNTSQYSTTTLTTPLSESGSLSDIIKLSLSKGVPVSNVTIACGTAAGTTTVGTLTPGGWQSILSFTASIIDDLIAEATNPYYSTVSCLATSADPYYNNLAMPLILKITDNDSPGISATPSTLSIVAGTSMTVDYVLTSAPTANVTLTISGGAGGTLSPTTLTFTPANWNIAQTVTFTTPSTDTILTPSIVATPSSADPVYAAVTVYTVNVTVSTPIVASTICTSCGGGGGGTGTSYTSIIKILTKTATTTAFITATTTKNFIKDNNLSCPIFTKFVKLGQTNDTREVTIWQKFLNSFYGAKLAVTGIYDIPSEKALRNFQWKYADRILKPWAYAVPTGYIYKTTQRVGNSVLGCPPTDKVFLEGHGWTDVK